MCDEILPEPDELALEVMSQLPDLLETDGAHELAKLFAWGYVFHGPIVGTRDPIDYFFDTMLCVVELPNGGKGYYWASLREMEEDDDDESGDGDYIPPPTTGGSGRVVGKRFA